jgi:hypothetical protein
MAATPVLSQARMDWTVHAPAAEGWARAQLSLHPQVRGACASSAAAACAYSTCVVCVWGGGVAFVAVLPGLADVTPPPHGTTASPDVGVSLVGSAVEVTVDALLYARVCCGVFCA